MYLLFATNILFAIYLQFQYPSLLSLFESMGKLVKYDMPTVYLMFMLMLVMPIFVNTFTIYVYSRYSRASYKLHNNCLYIFSSLAGVTFLDLTHMVNIIEKNITPNLFALNCLEMLLLMLNALYSMVTTFLLEMEEMKYVRKCPIFVSSLFRNLLIVFLSAFILNLVAISVLTVLIYKANKDIFYLIFFGSLGGSLISGCLYNNLYVINFHERSYFTGSLFF